MTLFTSIQSPIGRLVLTSNCGALTGIHMDPATIETCWKRDDKAEPFPAAVAQLAEYFRGERTEFDLPLAPDGTAFQRSVWEALQEIPFGETRSYAEIAKRIGKAKACRAVGLANGRNPIAVVIPCHRVIGADGSLTGYGGGLGRKKVLLDLETSVHAQLAAPASR